MSSILGLFGAISSVIRWAEPWDVEHDDDPLLDHSVGDDPRGLWA